MLLGWETVPAGNKGFLSSDRNHHILGHSRLFKEVLQVRICCSFKLSNADDISQGKIAGSYQSNLTIKYQMA